jgi:hypothetical protein
MLKIERQDSWTIVQTLTLTTQLTSLFTHLLSLDDHPPTGQAAIAYGQFTMCVIGWSNCPVW